MGFIGKTIIQCWFKVGRRDEKGMEGGMKGKRREGREEWSKVLPISEGQSITCILCGSWECTQFISMKKQVLETIEPRVLGQYQLIKKVGQGAYGQVWKVRDKQSSTIYALKKIYDAFRNPTDAQRAYRQIRYLEKLRHPNIIRIIRYVRPERGQDVYMTLEYMEADLSTAIKNNLLKEIHKHYIFFQIVNAVHYLHTAHLLHRDLKPSNILLSQNCQVKLCDFGLIRSLLSHRPNQKLVLTQNIATRWYRAPEVLLCSNSYGKEIDIWGLGCVLAEMFLGKPIFQGTSAISQLEKIFEVTGKPSAQELTFVRSEASRSIVRSMAVSKKRSISEIFERADKQLVDLLERIFQINPRKRISIEEIAKHPFVSRFHPTEEEQRKPSHPIRILYESDPLSPEEYKLLLNTDLEDYKLHPSELTTAKTSELSTFYQSSITNSLPNNSRRQYLGNNCPLGRAGRHSPEKPIDNRLFILPSFPSLNQYVREDPSPNPNSKKEERSLEEGKLCKKGLCGEGQRVRKKKNEMGEEGRILKTPEANKSYTPLKMKEALKNYHHSNQKVACHKFNNFFKTNKPTWLPEPNFQGLLYDNRCSQNSLASIASNRVSPSGKTLQLGGWKQFHPKRTMGVNEQLRRDRNVPKFILEGRKRKFRSGSPHDLQSIPNEDYLFKKQKTVSYLVPPNSSFKRMEGPKLVENRPSTHFFPYFLGREGGKGRNGRKGGNGGEEGNGLK